MSPEGVYGYPVRIVVYKATTVVYYNIFPFNRVLAMTVKGLRFGLLCLALAIASTTTASDSISDDNKITVAVASNFLATMKQLADTYQQNNGHVVVLSGGSTGKHYAQILHGAPFDLFFAADDLRPKLLEDKRVGVEGTRFTYAVGSLVIWSPEISKNRGLVVTELDQEALKTLLSNQRVKTLVMANPKLAPYGRAAQDVMTYLLPKGLASGGDHRIKVIRGENISQTFQFLMSGSADLGFIAHSQVLDPKVVEAENERFKKISDHYRLIPRELYQPIRQQAIQLNDKASTREFVNFIRGSVAAGIIEKNGYRVEGAADAG